MAASGATANAAPLKARILMIGNDMLQKGTVSLSLRINSPNFHILP
jgi:hypothetical protein